MKKRIALLLVFLLTLTAGFTMAGCGSEKKGIDETKTQLYVYNFDGGVGSDWLEAVSARFEEKYADTEFEPGTGKKGVEIVPGKGKDSLTTIATSEYNVIFDERVTYNDYISQGLFLDITDIVAEETLADVTDGKETGRIIDKMSPEQVAAFTALDGKHYVLPHYEVYTGIVYDVDVFTNNSLFFTQDGKWTKVEAEKSVGPDGVKGSYDDGLPSSYEELYKLITRMVQTSVIPFIWSGQYPTYTNDLLSGLWVAMAGKDEFSLNFNFGDGVQANTTEIVSSFDANGDPVLQEVTITPETGYLLNQQAAKYYAYQVLEHIMSNSSYYASDLITEVLTHLDAQTEFIYSDLENKPIGMIIEGSYWYNEASDSLKRSENTYKERAKNRNFAWMPLPRQLTGTVTEGNGTKNTVLDTLGAFGFINANIKDDANKVALAKKFLKFCYTDESLQEFTRLTGIPKALNYDLPTEGLDRYPTSLIQIRKNSDVVYPYSASKIFVNSQSSFSFASDSTQFASDVGSDPYKAPYSAFKAGVTARAYFEGSWSTKLEWDQKYSNFY